MQNLLHVPVTTTAEAVQETRENMSTCSNNLKEKTGYEVSSYLLS